MERDPLHDSVDRLLTERCTRKHVMDIEGGAPAGALWNALVELGLPDALVPEARGGAGLGLEDVTSVLLACGAHALPLPLAQTMVARAALASAGHEAPEGPIAISGEDLGEGVEIVCPRVPFGCTAEWVLVPSKGAALLLPVREASVRLTAIPRSLEADLRWEDHLGALRLEGEVEWRAVAATLMAALLAGALDRVLQRTIAHANERTQFGKSIGKFQAVQQQISVLAEHAFAARMAVQVACGTRAVLPEPLRGAVAKFRVSEAAVAVAAIAHAVHGAMGITEEFELQLYTRRLAEWRLAHGAESYWADRIGVALLRGSPISALDFILGRLAVEGGRQAHAGREAT